MANKALITFAFDHLIATGVQRLVINTHHRAEAFATAFPEKAYADVPLTFRHEAPRVLETAGGIKNVEDLLGKEAFIVYNGDILTDLPIERAIRAHFDHGHEVTMVLRSKDGPLQVSLDTATGSVTDIGKRLDPKSAADFLFTGIYIVAPGFFARIPPATKISVIPIFLEMIKSNGRLGGIVIDEGHWWDLGTREQYLSVHAQLPELGSFGHRFGPPPWVEASVEIASDVQLLGATAVGARARVGAGAQLEDCIVWPGAEICSGARLSRCIVTDGKTVRGAHCDEDL